RPRGARVPRHLPAPEASPGSRAFAARRQAPGPFTSLRALTGAAMQHHEHVGAHLVSSVVRAGKDEPAADVLARLAAEKPACAELVLAVDRPGRFEGAVPLTRLIVAPDCTLLKDLLDPGFPRVHPGDDQEQAASVALHHAVNALPVVDSDGRALGVMPAQALLQVLRREHVEDLHVLAGIQREAARARHAIEDPPLRRLRHRLPWLILGLAGSALATLAMASFESTLSRQVAVAFFVPG